MDVSRCFQKASGKGQGEHRTSGDVDSFLTAFNPTAPCDDDDDDDDDDDAEADADADAQRTFMSCALWYPLVFQHVDHGSWHLIAKVMALCR